LSWTQKQNRTPVGEIDFAAFVHDKLTDRQGVGLSTFYIEHTKLVVPQWFHCGILLLKEDHNELNSKK
jgi:hypothetical protein